MMAYRKERVKEILEGLVFEILFLRRKLDEPILDKGDELENARTMLLLVSDLAQELRFEDLSEKIKGELFSKKEKWWDE